MIKYSRNPGNESGSRQQECARNLVPRARETALGTNKVVRAFLLLFFFLRLARFITTMLDGQKNKKYSLSSYQIDKN